MILDSNVFNWIISPIGDCVKYVGDEVVNTAVLQRSIINISNMVPLLLIARQKFLENGKDDTGIRHLIAENEFLADKAKEFIESDFDPINSHGLIGLWCAVETAVEDTVVLILMNDDKAQSVLQGRPCNLMEVLKINVLPELGALLCFGNERSEFPKP